MVMVGVIILLVHSLLELFSIESQISLEKSSRMHTPTNPRHFFFNYLDILKEYATSSSTGKKNPEISHQNPR